VGETANVIELDGKKFNVEYTGNTIDGFTVTNKKPIDPPTPTPTPKTSDNSHVMSYALLTLLSAFFVVIVASKRIKYSN
jgi:putative cell wall surface anchor family protein